MNACRFINYGPQALENGWLFMDTTKSPTIHDVAKLAGVSLSTVSRVLNEYEAVNPQTRERVEAAIKELHYEKSKTDSSKSVKEKNTVGLIVPDILNPFFPLLIRGIEQVLKIHGLPSYSVRLRK